MMLVSLFADASHCPHKNVGGFGCWIKSARGTASKGGPLKGTVHTSTIAECMAIVNALYFGTQSNMIREGDVVLIQSDCKTAIEVFQRDVISKNRATLESYRMMRHVFEFAVKEHSLTIKFRHVAGHIENGLPRHWANGECDRLAKEGLNAARLRGKHKSI